MFCNNSKYKKDGVIPTGNLKFYSACHLKLLHFNTLNCLIFRQNFEDNQL